MHIVPDTDEWNEQNVVTVKVHTKQSNIPLDVQTMFSHQIEAWAHSNAQSANVIGKEHAYKLHFQCVVKHSSNDNKMLLFECPYHFTYDVKHGTSKGMDLYQALAENQEDLAKRLETTLGADDFHVSGN